MTLPTQPTLRLSYLLGYLPCLPKQLDDVIQLSDDDIKKRNDYTEEEWVEIEWRFVAHTVGLLAALHASVNPP